VDAGLIPPHVDAPGAVVLDVCAGDVLRDSGLPAIDEG